MRSGVSRTLSRRRMLAAGVAALALAAAGCSSSSSSSSTSAASTPVTGGTAVMAEAPQYPPTYIFPFMNSANVSNVNLFDFQYLMYRPLYWFGTGDQPTVNTSLSLANLPTVSGRTLTITLKHYMWSNGTPVTTQDVMFWLNLETAESTNFFGYTGFPANTSDITVVSPTELTMTMDQSYSPTWFLYNELSQITPMPAAWDRTASGPSSCATTVKDCAAVWSYLTGQASHSDTYASNPLWQIVDGPWRLSAFNADGHVTFVPNQSYSGPVKPKLAAFQELPFTTDAAEYDVLRSPSSSSKIDVGYLPTQDAPPVQPGQTVGTNPLHRLHAGADLPVGHRLLRDELPVDRLRPRGRVQAAVLPGGHGLPDEPGSDHQGPAARVRHGHRGPGRRDAGHVVAVGSGQAG